MSFFRKHGIVNVKMVITEEKILSNIDKIQKIINPASKKQIIQLEDDSYFKDLIDSVKTYLIEYPRKKNFPASVYRASYDLVEFATNLFEENTKEVEELIRQREKNINLANDLKDLYEATTEKQENWKETISASQEKFSEDIIETLSMIGRSKGNTSENYKSAVKLIEARINNLETNLHIEIDMERIEDKSKALSYIGIEVAEALKQIPTPVDYVQTATNNEVVAAPVQQVVAIEDKPKEAKAPVVNPIFDIEEEAYQQETRIEVKPSFWTKLKNTKIARTIGMLFKIRIVLEVPNALPEGNNNNQ